MRRGDSFIHAPLSEQRRVVASFLNLYPREDTWPLDVLDGLIALRINEGYERFFREVCEMMQRV